MTKETAFHNLPDEVQIFDRRLVRARRDRAGQNFGQHRFLADEVAGQMAERLTEINRRFDRILVLGDPGGALGDRLEALYKPGLLVRADLSAAMLKPARGLDLVASEELCPFRRASFGLVISNLTLHWVNDLPGALTQIAQVLQPDGLFLAALFGGTTLGELRQALARAEVATTGGLSPRISPFADIRDAGGLLQRAGFALPVADADTVTVTYENAFALMRELHGMGEANALHARQKTLTRRDTLVKAAELYAELFAQANGRIPATFQIFYLTGWAPDASQPKPLRPGSAKARLADALKAPEVSLTKKPGA